MAKYKFTKTIKPNEGICIGADGAVTRLPKQQSQAQKIIVRGCLSSGWENAAATAHHFEKPRHVKKSSKKRTLPAQQARCMPGVLPAPLICVTPKRKPKVIITLDSPENQYYGEPAVYTPPPARPCGMFGIFQYKPINKTAVRVVTNSQD